MPLIDLNGLGHFKDKENAMIAENFSATKDYAAGDYCYYNGTLKKFKTTHAAGAWIGTDAEDAKLAGDVSDLKSAFEALNDSVFQTDNILSSTFTSLNRTINSANKWNALGGATCGYVEIPEYTKNIVITPKAGVTNVWAFLNSIGTPTTGETPDFSTSYQTRITGNTATPITYEVENDMNYLYALIINSSEVDVFPNIQFVSVRTDDTLKEAHVPADAKATGDAIDQITTNIDALINSTQIPIGFSNDGSGYITYYTGNRVPDSTYDHTNYVDISQCAEISYKRTKSTSSGNVASGMAFYDADKNWISGVVSLKGQVSIGYTSDLYTIDVPENAKYARFSIYHDTDTYGNFSLYGLLKATNNINKSVANIYGLHEVPKNQGVLNCIKRARQMTDIKWTPAADIDRVNLISGLAYDGGRIYFQNKFKANKEYTGLPYSEKNFLGYIKSIDQFITSAANADSKECTESTYAGNYNVASYFGTVCVTLVGYALHIPQSTSPLFKDNPYLTKVFDIYSDDTYNDLRNLELCDILWASGHVAIVTDIVRDPMHDVTYIEVSESTKFGSFINDTDNGNYGGKCRRKMWAKQEFLSWFKSFAIYRYDADLLAAIPYTPNKYAPIANENPYPDSPYLPCIPDEGDKSKYSSLNVTILIRETGYSYLRVLKDGELFDTIDITGLTSTTVTCAASTEAIYEAYLCNISNDAETATSKSCSWLITNSTTNPTIHYNDDGTITITCTRKSNYAYPYFVIFNDNKALARAVTSYTVSKSSGTYTYTITVPAFEDVTISTIKFYFDFNEYAGAASSDLTPTVV